MPLLEQRCRTAEELRREGRIEEYDVDRSRYALEVAQGVGARHAGIPCLPLPQKRGELARRDCITLDEGDVSRPTRERFETERTAAGKKIEALRAG